MNEACEKFVENPNSDFRNFCKQDVANGVVTYVRTVMEAKVEAVDKLGVCCLTIKSKAFLWHQIRCMAGIIFLIGEGLESPEVITQLLDVEANPSRPQYTMASDVPLNLFEAEFEDGLEWNFSGESIAVVMKKFQSLWAEHRTKAAMLEAALHNLEGLEDVSEAEKTRGLMEFLLPKSRTKTYTPLMERLKCPTLEEKIEKNALKRQRLNKVDPEAKKLKDDQ